MSPFPSTLKLMAATLKQNLRENVLEKTNRKLFFFITYFSHAAFKSPGNLWFPTSLFLKNEPLNRRNLEYFSASSSLPAIPNKELKVYTIKVPPGKETTTQLHGFKHERRAFPWKFARPVT